MKKVLILFPLLLIVLLFNNRNLTSAEPFYLGQSDSVSHCIVSGEEFTGEGINVQYLDKNISLCNEGCIMAFKKEPAKYLKEDLLCAPCNDYDGKKDISAVHEGTKYYFCGNGCKKKFEGDAEKYLDEFSQIKEEKQK
jgi:YHS domain-containing protein